MAFGALPTNVPIPPILALNAMPNNTKAYNRWFFSALIPFNIPIVSGNIIAATAVLLIHMERNVVAVKR